jgi:hypothetical protein
VQLKHGLNSVDDEPRSDDDELCCKNTEQFTTAVQNIFTQFAQTHEPADLVFSPEFQPEEREIICIEAARRNLSMSFCGAGTERHQYMVFHRHCCRNVLQLVEYIRSHGGETLWHILVEPAGARLDFTVITNYEA